MPNNHETLASLFGDIADAIREKDGTSAEIVADTFPERISAIPTSANLQSKTVGPSTSVQIVTPDQDYDGLSSVTVNPMLLQEKTAGPSTSIQVITPDGDPLIKNTYLRDEDINSTTKTCTISFLNELSTPTGPVPFVVGDFYKMVGSIYRSNDGSSSIYHSGFNIGHEFIWNGTSEIYTVVDGNDITITITITTDYISFAYPSTYSVTGSIYATNNRMYLYEQGYHGLSQVTVNALPLYDGTVV